MKGDLKIKTLKKYMTILLTAFAFLFININNVNAETDYSGGFLFENNLIFNKKASYATVLDIENITDGNLNSYAIISNTLTSNVLEIVFDEPRIINNLYFKYEFNGTNTKNVRLYINQNDGFNQFNQDLVNGFNTINYDKPIEKLGIQISNIKEDEQFKFFEFDIDPFIESDIYKYNIDNLHYDIDNDKITFNYDLPTDDNFSHLELHQDGLLLADNIINNTFEITNLEYDTKYNFTFYAVSKTSKKSIGISREISVPSDPNLIPSNNIFSLTHSVSDTTVSFAYSLPLGNNFSHLKIYRNNELINDNYQLSEFIDTGLNPETEYNYRFVSVNKMDISNVGYAITIKTMEENDDVPPAVPTGLKTTNMNSGIVLSWNTNTESDIQGYYVYMNGEKMNSKPITNTIYNITNLENGLEYNFTVSAVDTFGNESKQSPIIIGVPDVDQLPIFKLDTKLSSVGSSVENWFSEIWLIVAFATAIPLSFVIAGRVKGLFIA